MNMMVVKLMRWLMKMVDGNRSFLLFFSRKRWFWIYWQHVLLERELCLINVYGLGQIMANSVWLQITNFFVRRIGTTRWMYSTPSETYRYLRVFEISCRFWCTVGYSPTPNDVSGVWVILKLILFVRIHGNPICILFVIVIQWSWYGWN